MFYARIVIASFLFASPCFAQEGQRTNISQSSQTRPSNEYILAAGDELRVTVFNEPDLSGEQRLSADGEISLPLIGDVGASGMSSAQLSDLLEERFRDGFLTNPNVSVAVITYRPIYVTGEVTNPGAFAYAADMNVTTAVATAGGFTQHASRSRLYIRRAGAAEEQPVDGSVALAPGDTVRVGQGFMAAFRNMPLGLLSVIVP